jgi:hypothetical protein
MVPPAGRRWQVVSQSGAMAAVLCTTLWRALAGSYSVSPAMRRPAAWRIISTGWSMIRYAVIAMIVEQFRAPPASRGGAGRAGGQAHRAAASRQVQRGARKRRDPYRRHGGRQADARQGGARRRDLCRNASGTGRYSRDSRALRRDEPSAAAVLGNRARSRR